MADTPDPRAMRPRPAWEGRLDSIDDRLDSLGAQMAQLTEAMNADRERRAEEATPDLSHDLAILSDRVSDTALDSAVNREVLSRLDATVADLSDSLQRLIDSVSSVNEAIVGLRATVVGRDSGEFAATAINGLADQLRSVDRRMVSRTDIDEVRQRVEQAEVALAHQANIIGEALRRRVDDQRTLAGELGAQLSNLSASVSDSVDLPDKVRREIRKEVSELAEHLGVAMRDLKAQLGDGSTTELPALTSGIDRLSGRIQADNQRLSQSVSAAQAANDERMRRLDTQVTELKQRLELIRLSQPLKAKPRVAQENSETPEPPRGRPSRRGVRPRRG